MVNVVHSRAVSGFCPLRPFNREIDVMKTQDTIVTTQRKCSSYHPVTQATTSFELPTSVRQWRLHYRRQPYKLHTSVTQGP